MNVKEDNNRLPEYTRKKVFRALVSAQDLKISVAESRKLMVERFKVTDGEVRQIETEGVENQWPPLGIYRIGALLPGRH